jgi:hypothetical protein
LHATRIDAKVRLGVCGGAYLDAGRLHRDVDELVVADGLAQRREDGARVRRTARHSCVPPASRVHQRRLPGVIGQW